MRVGPGGRLGVSLAAGLILVTCGTAAGYAQSGADPRLGPAWSLRGLRSAQCVRFLVAPGEAGRHAQAGFRPVRADQDTSLHTALESVIQGQPEFASWTPSSLCFFYLDTVSLAGRTMTAKKGGRPQMVSVWTIAATRQQGGERQDLVLELSAGSAQTVRAAEAVKLRVREAESRISQAPNGTDELHELKIGKTRLVWNGRAVGDSSRVDHPIEERWLVKGASGTSWNVRLTLTPLWTRPLVGVLSVEGKDDLAKSLKASPTRFLGPRYLGGSAELIFSR